MLIQERGNREHLEIVEDFGNMERQEMERVKHNPIYGREDQLTFVVGWAK